MEISKDITVTCKDGDLEVRMGKRLTSIYFKGVEKFVFHDEEIDKLIAMLQASKEKLKE
jgi:coproporphyrinogen III oxidase-like Fe-S oxidoreductase